MKERLAVEVRCWQILLQKSQNAERLIFRERMKQAAIADRCSLKRAAEVACEFVAGCSSPPHQYSIAAPTARKSFDRWCKKTFATKSALSGPDIRPSRCPLLGAKRTGTTWLISPDSGNQHCRSLKSTSVSKSKRDSIAERVQQIV